MRAMIILLCCTVAASCQVATLAVDTYDSKIIWTGTKVIGFHQGTVQLLSGQVTMTNGKLSGGYFVINMNSIACTDIPATEPTPKNKLERHLKSDEFFDVAKYPTAQFTIRDVKPHPTEPRWLWARGELTVKSVTRELTLTIEPVTQKSTLLIAQANVRFNRKRWGVAYTGIKDELVHDEIKLNVIIRAK